MYYVNNGSCFSPLLIYMRCISWLRGNWPCINKIRTVIGLLFVWHWVQVSCVIFVCGTECRSAASSRVALSTVDCMSYMEHTIMTCILSLNRRVYHKNSCHSAKMNSTKNFPVTQQKGTSQTFSLSLNRRAHHENILPCHLAEGHTMKTFSCQTTEGHIMERLCRELRRW